VELEFCTGTSAGVASIPFNGFCKRPGMEVGRIKEESMLVMLIVLGNYILQSTS
jgi:hypothetical protein